MLRAHPLLAVVLSCLAPSSAAFAQEQEPVAPGGVTRAFVHGGLDVGTLGLIKRAVGAAQERGDSHLVIEIDTPGGLIDEMWRIARAVRDAASRDLTVVAWVHDHALSAGVGVALACDRIYMTPQGVIGAAVPVQFGVNGIEALPEEGGVREKVSSSLRGDLRAMAEREKRPGALAEAMVDPEVEVKLVKIAGEPRVVSGKEWDDLRAAGDPPELVRTIAKKGEILTLTASQAVELGFADGIAETFDVLLDKMGCARAAVQTVERAHSDDVVTWLDRLSPLLIIAGLVLAYAELKAPGFGFAGILAIACFAAVLVGRYLAGLADIPHIVAVALGVALIAAEVFVFPGTLWLGITGGVLAFGGLIWASLGPGFDLSNRLDQHLILDASFHLVLSGAVAVAIMLLLSRFLPKTPVLRGLVLAPERGPASAAAPAARVVRARGRALTDLRPVGKIEVDGKPGEIVEAQASGGWIPAGSAVEVVDESTGRWIVEAAPASGVGDAP